MKTDMTTRYYQKFGMTLFVVERTAKGWRGWKHHGPEASSYKVREAKTAEDALLATADSFGCAYYSSSKISPVEF